ncbi:MAG TPA: MMPL family transporter, partial [Rectinemataceae bacterium]
GSEASAEDLVLALEKESNYRGAAYYEIPADPARYGLESQEELKGLISNYLVFLSGSLSAFADDPFEPESIRMSVQLRTMGQKDTELAIDSIRAYVKANFPKDVEVEIGGTALVEASLNDLVVQSQIVSVLVSLLLVCVILSVYYRSIVAGLIGLAPLSVSILINFAIMGFTGIKLNIGTAMVASIAVGTGIDYTIHYMAAYHHEYLLTGGMGEFLRRTFLGSGKVILLNAISVGLGFLVLALSQFNILADLGKLIFIAMVTSSLVSLTLLPVLLEVVRPAFIRKPLPSDRNQAPTEVLE